VHLKEPVAGGGDDPAVGVLDQGDERKVTASHAACQRPQLRDAGADDPLRRRGARARERECRDGESSERSGPGCQLRGCGEGRGERRHDDEGA
jgi:hypothetical protein